MDLDNRRARHLREASVNPVSRPRQIPCRRSRQVVVMMAIPARLRPEPLQPRELVVAVRCQVGRILKNRCTARQEAFLSGLRHKTGNAIRPAIFGRVQDR